MLEQLLAEAGEKMDKALISVEHDLNSLRTGRASTATVDGLKVMAYGSENPLNQVASVSTPDATTILIQPWDPNLVAPIEKVLLGANLGMTPSNDGKVIRLHVPALTEETRKELVKKAHLVAEQGRVAVRSVRRHANEEIKKTEKDHKITEDERHKHLDEVQKKTDEHVKTIGEMMAKKEQEIMHV